MSPTKIISAIVAIAIIIAVLVFVYINLPKQTDTHPEDTTPPETNPTVFTLIYDDEQKNYTMAELERLEPYTAKGGYRTQKGSIKGYGNYTGVNVTTLIHTFQPTLNRYSLKAFASDGYNTSYNYSTIQGDINIYDPDNTTSPNPIGKGNLTMVLAYRFEGDWLNETDDGKLRIVFIDEQGSITESGIWLKMITSIRIITE
jgi:hypothetical protein